MIKYSTNWMGPVSLQWYKDRGLVEHKQHILGTDSTLNPNRKKGDIVEYDDIIEQYACGRIDVYGTDEPFPEEISLPIMKGSDWNRFSDWLREFSTEEMWTLEQLVEEFEKTNDPINWWKENDGVNNG